MTDDQKLSEAEIEVVQRDRFLADPAVPADQYPRLWNISAGMVYERVIRALEPSPPEYVTVLLPPWGRRDIELSLAITDWNLLWEAAQFRRRIFSEEQLPYPLRDIADRGDVNVVFVPGRPAGITSTRRCFTCYPGASSDITGCRWCAAGNGRILLSSVTSTAISLRTSRRA